MCSIPFSSILEKNKRFWTRLLPDAWEALSFDQKLSWVVFGIYTVALLTIMELLFFRS